MEVKIVVGANYGDEGKGLVSGCLARDAASRGNKVLTVFYNGTGQRSHTFEGVARHLTGAGAPYGADTFYHQQFVVDPIMIWLSGETPIIDPRCRVILPCDVLYGQSREKQLQHGSCGFGLFSAVKRNADPNYSFYVKDFLLPNYPLIQKVDSYYKYTSNGIHNLSNFLRAIVWARENCRIATFDEVVKDYDTIIYEGGQGLLLDQANKGDFPHLTPSSTGAYNIHADIEKLGARADLYYVSRSYITRHGNGPMDAECGKSVINPDIIDLTNQSNDWQGSLRFGRIDMEKLYKRVNGDAAQYNCDKTINMVFTHLNYTNNELETTEGRIAIAKPQFLDNLYVSDKKDYMEIMKQSKALLLFLLTFF